MRELSEDELAHLERRRWRKRVYRAANFTYLGMTLIIVGAGWWWMATPDIWSYPPPTGGVLLLALGIVTYIVSRGWLVWLRMPRNRPS